MSRLYFQYLDALRFFACLAVFIAHSGILFPISADWFYSLYRTIISQGAYGVNFFFILSGFLITFLLLREKTETGDINIKTFYLKRIIRIWPLYFIIFIISVFILPLIVRALGADYVAGDLNTFPNLGMDVEGHGIWWFVVFIGNFFRAYDLGATPFALGVLWSVCVEEQFYLIWPWIVKKLRSKYVLYVAILFFALSLIYKAIHINDANIAYYSTLSVALDLATGCALGYMFFRFEPQVRKLWGIGAEVLRHPSLLFKRTNYIYAKIKSVGKDLIKDIGKTQIRVAAGLFGIILGIYLTNIFYVLMNSDALLFDTLRLMKRPVLDLVFAFILLYFLMKNNPAQTTQTTQVAETKNQVQPKNNIPTFTYLGKISYGLYGYHAIFIILTVAIFNHFGMGPNDVTVPKFIAIFLISGAATIVAAHYSYKFIEVKFLALRSRFVKKA